MANTYPDLLADASTFSLLISQTYIYASGSITGSFISGSFIGDGTEIEGVISSSYSVSSSHADFAISASHALRADEADSVAFDDITGKPTLVSSSLQFNNLDSPFTGSFTGSFVGDGSGIEGVISSSYATTSSYALFAVSSSHALTADIADSIAFDNITGKPTLISSSLQFNDLTSPFTGSFTGSFVGDGTGIEGVISSSYSITSSYSDFALSSSHALRADEADSVAFDDITGKPTLISSSLQFNNLNSPFTGSFTGSFVGDGSGLTGIGADSIAFDDITDKPTLISSSLQFNNLNSPFTGSFTGSFVGDGTGLTGVAADSVAFDNITGKPTLVSSSLQFNNLNSPFTGSFTGSFVGDGTGLTGVAADSVAFDNITGKPTLISSSLQFNNLSSPFTGSFTGSFVGDGSGLTGIGQGTVTGTGTDNQVMTSTGGTGIQGESNLTFDGSTLIVTGGITGSTTLTIGSSHTNTGTLSTIVGGTGNTVEDSNDSIVGGQNNRIINSINVAGQIGHNSIIGGCNNKIDGTRGFNFIAGGYGNTISGSVCGYHSYANIILGRSNIIDAQDRNSISGGGNNIISGSFSNSNIAGGVVNRITGQTSTIGGGASNCVLAGCSIIAGGEKNSISSTCSIIGGGCLNTITSACSGILGGFSNCVAHSDSFIIGSNLTSTATCTTFINNLNVEGTISGSVFSGSFVGDGSGLTGIEADSIAFDDITGKPTLISSSLQFNNLNSPFTGSFTGSFVGDGTGLTGIGQGTVTGTGADAQIATWASSTGLEGSSNFTFNGNTLSTVTSNALTQYAGIFIDQNGTGDATTTYAAGSAIFTVGIDNSNSDTFTIASGNSLGTSNRLEITTAGAATFSSTVTATNFILSSDKSLKENIEDLDKVVDAKWRSYKFKDDDEVRYGVIAQELEETNPELIRTNDQGLKSVAYIDLLIAKIAELEARLDKAGL